MQKLYSLFILSTFLTAMLGCKSNRDCLFQGSLNNLRCHPLEQRCTECISNSDCSPQRPHCTPKGLCTSTIRCNLDCECKIISDFSICSDELCTFMNMTASKTPELRELGVTTTPVTNQVAYIESDSRKVLLSSDEDYIYVAAGGLGVRIYQIVNFKDIYLISSYDSSCIEGNDLAVSEDESYLYLVADNNLCIFDISNKALQIVSQSSNFHGTHIKKFKDAPMLATLDELSGLFFIIDVTNPANPLQISTEFYPESHELEIINNNQYILAASYYGLLVIKVTSPENPTVEYNYTNIPCSRINVQAQALTAYVAGVTFFVLNIEDLSSITILGNMTLESEPQNIQINDGLKFAYLPSLWEGTVILDFSNLNKIRRYGSFSSKYATSLAPYRSFTGFIVGDDTAGMTVFQNSKFESSIPNVILGTSLIKEFSRITTRDLVILPHHNLLYVSVENVGIYIMNITDIYNPVLIKTLSYTHKGELQLKFTPDFSHLIYGGFPEGILIFDMTDPLNPAKVSTIPIANAKSKFEISSTGNWLITSEGVGGAKFYDISIPSSPFLLNHYNKYVAMTRMFQNDTQKLLAITRNSFAMMDISNLNDIVILSFVKIIDGTDIVLDKYEKFAFVADSKHGVRVVDVSYPNQLILWYPIPGTDSNYLYYDGTMLYVSDLTANIGVYIVDINDPTSAQVKGLIPSKQANRLLVEEDVMYLCDGSAGLKVYKMFPNYILVTTNSKTDLGTTTVFPLLLGTLHNDQVVAYASVYKIIKMQLSVMETDPTSGAYKPQYSPLSSWMKGDLDKGQITFSSAKSDQIGFYSVYVGVSTKISSEDFIGIGDITTTNQSAQFIVDSLLGRYIDVDGYLLPSFDVNTELVLGPEKADIEEEVRLKLGSYYIQSIVDIEVKNSLLCTNLTMDGRDYIGFDSPSLSTVTVRLSFGNPNATFMSVTYETSAFISFSGSVAIITGSVFDTNIALKILRVDLKNLNHSSGNVSINDALNPAIKFEYQYLSAYFIVNRAPYESYKIQRQIDGMSILTGTQFSLILDQYTFYDPDEDKLTYKLLNLDGSSIPAWIRLSDTTLSGTPPNELNLKVTLKIVATDGYKTAEAVFTIKPAPSASFILSLIGTYIGPVIGAIGFWAYAITLYNIGFKNSYTFPNPFTVKPGMDVNDNMIYPITLQGKEIEEANMIWDAMKKLLRSQNPKRKKRSEKIKPLDAGENNTERSIFFEGEHTLDIKFIMKYLARKDGTIEPEKLENFVEEIVKNSPQLMLNRYIQPKFPHQRQLIIDLIKDKLTNIVLKHEKMTFDLLNAVKETDWGILCRPKIQLHDDILSKNDRFEFEVCEEALGKKLEEFGFKIIKPDEVKHDFSMNSEKVLNAFSPNSENLISISPYSERLIRNSIKTSLKNDIAKKIDPEKVNIPLLKEGVHAFYKSKYNVSMPETLIIVRCLKVDKRIGLIGKIKSFLKLDLVELSFNNRNTVGYGLKYKITKETVHFYGKPYREFEGNTLVFQMLSKKNKILREIIINGDAEDAKDEENEKLKGDDLKETFQPNVKIENSKGQKDTEKNLDIHQYVDSMFTENLHSEGKEDFHQDNLKPSNFKNLKS